MNASEQIVSLDRAQRNPVSSPRLATIAGLSIIVICIVVYHGIPAQEIANYDDVIWVGVAEQPGFATLKRIFTWDLTWGEARSRRTGYYAPLPAASIMLDLQLEKAFAKSDAVLKTSNLMWHILNSIAVLYLIRCLGFGLWISFTVASIFAIHPMQVSTVAWIAERKNLVMALFFLVGLICYCKYRQTERKGFYWGALVAYCLGLLSKPSAIVFGPCMVITDLLLFDRRLTVRSILRATPVLALGILWTVLVTSTEGAVGAVPPLWDRILLLPYKISFLLGKYFFPTDLTLIYPPLAVDAAPFLLWIPVVVLVIVGILLLAVHRSVPIWNVLWGVSFYVLNLLPSSGIVPFAGMNELYVADHYQYLALIGASLVVAVGVNGIASRCPARTGLHVKAAFTAVSILMLGTVAARLIPMWDNGETLWTHVISKNPVSSTAHYNYAHYLDEKGRLAEAATEYTEAVAVDHNLYQADNNLGIIMLKQGRLDAAADYFGQAIAKNPTFGEPHLALAKILFFQASYKEALEHCRKASQYGADCQPEELEKAIYEKMNESEK